MHVWWRVLVCDPLSERIKIDGKEYRLAKGSDALALLDIIASFERSGKITLDVMKKYTVVDLLFSISSTQFGIR